MRSQMPMPSPTRSLKPTGNSPPTSNASTIAFVHERWKEKDAQPPTYLPPRPPLSLSSPRPPVPSQAPWTLSPSDQDSSPKERHRRIEHNMCLFCGGQGHVARFYPNKPLNPLCSNEAYFTSTPSFLTPPASVTSSLPSYSRPPYPKPEFTQSPFSNPAEN